MVVAYIRRCSSCKSEIFEGGTMRLGKEGVCLCQKGGLQGFQGQPIKRRFRGKWRDKGVCRLVSNLQKPCP